MQLMMRLRLKTLFVCALVACEGIAQAARAEDKVAVGASTFHESGGPLNMTVIVPTVSAKADVFDALGVGIHYTADVVSGASVAVVDAPAKDVDAIVSASVKDVRHSGGGSLELREASTTVMASFTHAAENDYRSNIVDISARTDLFDNDTRLSIGYARAFDSVCDGAAADEAVQKTRLDSSDGCFAKHDNRQVHGLAIHNFNASWTQALMPILNLQTGLSAELLHGFQSNPYRAVVIGKTAAQEHHPEDRARYALSVSLRLWLNPLNGAVQTYVRAYRDTWNIRSLTLDVGYEQNIAAGLRARVRGRLYDQTGASFYSDDYVLQPRGQYFTGDRELSPMHSIIGGGQLTWGLPADDDGEVLGFLSALEITLKGDLMKHFFDDFHYGKAEVPNTLAWLASFTVDAGF
jgi:hypothetical protein